MTKLSGKALQDRARELDIQGRSKMSADELREAIANAERITAVPDTATDRNGDFITPPVESEPTTVVFNRADKRAIRRSRHLRNDGAPRGGVVKVERPNALVDSIRAGEKANGYGTRNLNALRIDTEISLPQAGGPRNVPVSVIHDGH